MSSTILEEAAVENDKSDPLISVIVPIYNVAPYLRKCLDSLRNQSLKQIEIICIDDGSTDESGRIADEYGRADSRFRIIHTENRGLSAARNTGIDEARADWIMFVDSDDWVEPDFCRIPYKAAIKNNADMVIFQNYNATEGGRVKKRKKKSVQTSLVNHETAVDVGWTAVWNRLYQKNLFYEIRYPEGHVYEDYAITHRLVYRAQRIVSVSDSLYYYRNRKGSICHSITGEADRLKMSKRRYQELIDLGYPEEKARAQLIGAALRCCGRVENTECEIYIEAKKIIETFMDKPLVLSNKEEKMLMLWRRNKSLYRVVYKVFI